MDQGAFWLFTGRFTGYASHSVKTIVTLAVLVTAASGLFGQTVSITEFAIPYSGNAPSPVGITAGPDGHLWFTEINTKRIGRITTSGTVTEFPAALTNQPFGITTGPDGNVWFTEGNLIGRMTPNGVLTEFLLPAGGGSTAWITVGSDGNLWFVEEIGNQIGRITTTGVVTEFPIPTGGSRPTGLTAGPDGNLWFTESGANKIGRITTAGVITEFNIPTSNSGPYCITAGPDGNLWFTENLANRIGRITPAGAITEFPMNPGGGAPTGITVGPDGNLWFMDWIGNKLARITPSGIIAEFPIPTVNSGPQGGMTIGPDSNLWFTEISANQIAKVSITTPSYSATVQPPIRNDGSSVFNASRGSIPSKFTLSLNGDPTCQLPLATIAVTRIAGAAPGPVNQADFITPSDSGVNFRIDACQYVYNLSASSLGPGTYLVQIVINSVPIGQGQFGLQ
jgi:streptogramin lyase